MVPKKDRFWAKVLFKEFIRHYRKLTAEQKVADIEASMDALEDIDGSGDSFGAKMVRWSMERVEQYPMASENGRKGGRPRKETTTPETSVSADGKQREGGDSLRGVSSSTRLPSRSRPPRNFDEVRDFVETNGLDYDDARLWWERNYVERKGRDKDGNPILNWKGALVNACKAEEKKRSA